MRIYDKKFFISQTKKGSTVWPKTTFLESYNKKICSGRERLDSGPAVCSKNAQSEGDVSGGKGRGRAREWRKRAPAYEEECLVGRNKLTTFSLTADKVEEVICSSATEYGTITKKNYTFFCCDVPYVCSDPGFGTKYTLYNIRSEFGYKINI